MSTAAVLRAALFSSALICLPTPSMGQPKTIAVECANFPPACIEQGQPGPGLLVEVGVEAVTRAGFTPVVRFVPWKRAQFEVMHATDAIIVYFARTPERETSYQWLETTNETGYAFATKEGTPPIDTLDQAMKLELIGIPSGSNVREWLLQHNIKQDTIKEAAIDSNVQKLQLGRISAYFGTPMTFSPIYSAMIGKTPVIGKQMYAEANWVAAGLRFPKDAADKIAAALRAIKSDGTLERIKTKYDGTDGVGASRGHGP
jgi:polar amino acid transport system substrate-binding protein